MEYNKQHHITPRSTTKSSAKSLEETFFKELPTPEETPTRFLDPKGLRKKIKEIEKKMYQAAKEYRFEEAAQLRDEMRKYQQLELIEDQP